MLHPSDLLGGRFEIERLAGSGGMGAVFRARDRATGSHVALKVLRFGGQELSRRFEREAAFLAELCHPAIVRYVSHGVTGEGRFYLAMEWLDGEDLSKRLDPRGLTVEESLLVARHVAKALAFAHARGVVHRDIKPSNLYLRGGRVDDVVVLDFGLARRLSGGSQLTVAGAVLGTPAYMAPEQARGSRDVDSRADVYSLGGVLFRCLTGEPPFGGKDTLAVLGRVLFEEPRRPSEMGCDAPPEVDDLVLRMLAKTPGERPASGVALLAEIDSAVRACAAGGGRRGKGQAQAQAHGHAHGQEEAHERAHALLAAQGPLALTTGEQVLVSVLVAATDAQIDDERTVTDDTFRASAQDREAMGSIARRFGARFEELANGAVVLAFTGQSSATDQVARAARCALAIRAERPGLPMALATGRGARAGSTGALRGAELVGAAGERLPVGDGLDRAARLLRTEGVTVGDRGGVTVDEVTAGLLETRFEVRREGERVELCCERSPNEAPRTLLGAPSILVGRARELALLQSMLEECCTESTARGMLVVGPAGIGKTRLRIEFLHDVAQLEPRPQVWIGRGDPMGERSSFGLLAQAIRSLAAIDESQPLEDRHERLRARLAHRLGAGEAARVVAFLGELVGAPPPEQTTQLTAARADPVLMGDQLRRAWLDLVAAECETGPVVLVLENLQYADAPSLRLALATLRAHAQLPLMVLGLGRPEIDDLFPDLRAHPALHRLGLTDLTKKSCQELIRRALGADVSREVVAGIVARAGGNAYYLEELIRSVAEGKGEALPATVVAMAQARVERLNPDLRRVLRAGSIFGRVFWPGGVAALLAGDDAAKDVVEKLEELVGKEVLLVRPGSRFGGNREYAFRSELLERAAYSMLTDADRALGHELAARWLEKAGEHDAAVLAEHFERGRNLPLAAEHFARAGQMLVDANDWDGAVAVCERGIACGAKGEVRGALRLVQAEARHQRGDNELAEAAALEALCHFPRGEPGWCTALGFLAAASTGLGEKRAIVEYAGTIHELLSSGMVHPPLLAAAAHVVAGLVFTGRYVDARALLERIDRLDPALRERDLGASARLQYARALSAQVTGDLSAHLDLSLDAARKFEALGDVRRACLQLVAVGAGCTELGDYQQAEQVLSRAIASGSKMGLLRLVAAARANLGVVLTRIGRLTTALEEGREAASALGAQTDKRLAGGARAYLAFTLLASGDAAAAEAEAAAAVDLLQRHPPTRCLALGVQASARLALSDPEGALEAASNAMAVLDALGGLEEGEALVRLSHARALFAVEHVAEARQAAGIAKEKILARARKIADPARRSTFLDRIREHAETFALAEWWPSDGDRAKSFP